MIRWYEYVMVDGERKDVVTFTSGNNLFSSADSDFDPFKFRSKLIEKSESQWKEVANISKIIDNAEVESYQLAGNTADPVVVSYTLSS